MTLSFKHQQFINEYLQCWNATEAYRRVYPKASEEAARVSASGFLTNPNISAEIQRRVDENGLSANEVVIRLAEQARGDIGDFLDWSDDNIRINLDKPGAKTRLIKKIAGRRTVRTHMVGETEVTTEDSSFSLELYDAHAAQIMLGKTHGLFADEIRLRKEMEKILTVLQEALEPDEYSKALEALGKDLRLGIEAATGRTEKENEANSRSG